MFSTYYVPKSSLFNKIIGQTIDTNTLFDFVEDYIFQKKVNLKEEISPSEKTSLLYLTKIIKETEEKGFSKVFFEENSFPLEKTFVIIIGEKNNLYGIIMKPELVTEKDSTLLSLYRIQSNLDYISTQEFSSLFHSF